MAAPYIVAFTLVPSGPSGLPGPTGYFYGPGPLPAAGLTLGALGTAFA